MSARREWSPLELVRWTTEYFGHHQIPTPRLDAELLLAHVLETERMQLYLRFEEAVADGPRARYRELVRRRAEERLPVAYLTGVREFWSQPFRVSEDVLIPRADTELLVETAVEWRPRRFADVGTGCGAIAACVLLERPEARALVIDRSARALAVARENFEALGVADRAELIAADGLEALASEREAAHGGSRLDLIVSNPPYIPSGELMSLPPEVGHEPALALDGGSDGLALLRRLVQQAPSRLARPGRLAFEVGVGQASAVCEMLQQGGASSVEIRKDLAGIERVVAATYEAAE